MVLQFDWKIDQSTSSAASLCTADRMKKRHTGTYHAPRKADDSMSISTRLNLNLYLSSSAYFLHSALRIPIAPLRYPPPKIAQWFKW